MARTYNLDSLFSATSMNQSSNKLNDSSLYVNMPPDALKAKRSASNNILLPSHPLHTDESSSYVMDLKDYEDAIVEEETSFLYRWFWTGFGIGLTLCLAIFGTLVACCYLPWFSQNKNHFYKTINPEVYKACTTPTKV